MRVIYIDIDSLRPDHLGCYGYARPTTPNIDRLAQQGIRFTQCFSSDSPCMPSRAATISGTFGIKNGVVTHGERASELQGQQSTLPYVLRQHRIPAVAISSFGRHPSPWFYVGWNEFIDPIDRPELSFQQIAGEEVVDRAIRWLDENRALTDFYLYVQLWDPHAVYEAPQSFVDAARNDNYPARPTPEDVETDQRNMFWHSAKGMGIASYEDWQRMIDEYDGEIRYVDNQIGRLLAALEELEPEGDMVVILSADHGEEHGEHGLYVEHWSVHNGTQHIPLIIRDSRRRDAGTVFDGLVYQMDITSTVCHAFAVPAPARWDSKSLLKQRDGVESVRPYLVCGHGLYTAQRTVITTEWKLIRTYHPGMWEIPKLQLFRRADIWEQDNVASIYPEEADRLDGLLRAWEEEHRVGCDPMMTNVAQRPHGSVYAKGWTDQFLTDGVHMPVVRSQRKREPEAR